MDATERSGFEVDDPAQIRLLGSPVRNDVVLFLDGEGPATVASIARGLGRPADTLYYHLGRLEEAGLIVRRGEDGGEAAVFDVPGRPVTLRYRPDDPANAAAIVDAVGTTLRSVERRFGAALAEGAFELSGPERNLWASRGRGRLTDAELAEVNEAIRRILAIFRGAAGSDGGRMHEVTLVVVPLPEEPADRRKG